MLASVNWNKNEKYSLSSYNIEGFVEFYQKKNSDPVEIYVYIEGLPDGLHGFHIHEKPVEFIFGSAEDCCSKLGGHFHVGKKWSLESQDGTKHGIEGHTGDLCNNVYTEKNITEKKFYDHKISLFQEDKNCIIGRSLIIHEDEDDCGIREYLDEKKNIERYITGNAGKRIACGNVILEEY
jgi:superoxide dismutase, Cu-Zn family